jgi:hypothetical protein
MGTHRQRPHPDWTQGPPGRDTLLDESRWPYADGWQGRASWEELQHARFLLWWLTAADGEEPPARLRIADITAPSPAASLVSGLTCPYT